MKIVYIIAFFLIALTGCNKYLDIPPKGYVIPKSYSDFDLLLNSFQLITTGDASAMFLSDDEDNVYLDPLSQGVNDLTYLWDDQPVKDNSLNPPIWGNVYRNVSYYNTLLNGIPRDTKDSIGKVLVGQALVGRAYEFLYLLNLYGAIYNPATADKDLGISWMQSVDLSSKAPQRTSVKNNYDSIISNIEYAIPSLPNDNKTNRYRADKASAYSVLARTFLYMSNYDSAAYYADLASKGKEVLALNQLDPAGKLETYDITKQASNIFLRVNKLSVFYTQYYMDTTLAVMFDTSDYRLKMHYYNSNATNKIIDSESLHTRGAILSNLGGLDINYGTTVEEMKLIIAEAAARKGDISTALNNVNLIIKNNVSNKAYKPISTTSKDSALYYVIRERRKQFAFTGLRWLDMRRLKGEGLIPTINRLNEDGEIIKSLPPTSLKYVLQIPDQVYQINPNIVQNPR